MIKIFRNRVCLYTVTTAILSLLQNGIVICASAEEYGGRYKITVSHPPYKLSVIPMLPTSSNLESVPLSPVPNMSRERLPSISGQAGNYNALSGRRNGSLSGLNGERKPFLSGFGGNNSSHPPLKGIGGDKDGGRYVYTYDRTGKDKLILYDGAYYICDNCKTDTINDKSYKIMGENSDGVPSSRVAITVKKAPAEVKGKNITVRSEVEGKPFVRGVSVSEGGKITLTDLKLSNAEVALHASDGRIEVNNGYIRESKMAVQAIGKNTNIALKDVQIKTNGEDKKASVYSYGDSEVNMSGGSLDFMNGHGVYSALGGKVKLENVNITGRGDENKKHAVLYTDLGGSVTFQGTIDAENMHGILLENTIRTPNSVPLFKDSESHFTVSEVDVSSSSITVKGDGAYGIYFKGGKPWENTDDQESLLKEELISRVEVVNLRRTMFSVLDGTALYSTGETNGAVSLLQSSLHSENSLLRAEEGASIIVLADASTLEGSSYVDEDSNAELYLSNESAWILQRKKQENQHEAKIISASSVSRVSLMNDSAIKFINLKPDSNYTYHTLHIGHGIDDVYRAQDGAHIYINTFLDGGGDINKQKTDRILIYGDVSGKTMVHVHGVSGSPGGPTGSGGNDQGISIIQVSGKANQNSFQLEGGYVALDNSPYQYKLYSYGPQSNLGKANPAQRLVKGSGEFWDYRLETGYMTPEPEPPAPSPEPGPSPTPPPGPEPKPHPKPGVKAVVPQVPTYLLLPNALFHTGLMNITHTNKWLEPLRIVSGGMLERRENPAFFVRGYGGNHRYRSNLSRLEYGYGGELDYNAIDAGVLLQTFENRYGASSFGVIGSYQRLSLQPLDVEQSRKSTFDRWAATAYGGMQWDTGFYADGLLSYGLFKGDVHTLARGKTATLKGRSLSAALTSGKAFVIGDDDLIFDPQVQIVYQRLQFDKARDIDAFDIEMGTLDQWLARIGGRLTKVLPAADEAHVISLYGKLHVTHNFGKKQFVQFKDAFQLGAFGSSLETGLGFNAQLSPKFTLHGDLVYQHKLTKAGFSGASFTGGLRYNF
ncbi:autotransporter outer membrane beta-barrel domain-containing protein [Bartonella sp. ML69XJBT]|uniref:autotransporter outer membrane beta-barrel domain-containing protein n=1 Tax=Bartonella sp. ML69XJBT TaxID=3019092 RepID=UPI00235FF5F3|nr:autotransporter outer membrane beta-barrel domain-containing protein [Bartonella sp. ML69XJBT]